jgi:hypothetical protein
MERESMDYDDKMEKLVVSNELWPSLRNPEFIGELESIAEDAFSNSTIEGYLSSVLIFQQIAEEMTRVLLKSSQMLIKIGLWGTAEINFAKQDSTMFGRLMDELKKTIAFDEKGDFIEECNKLNEIRIRLVHGLAKSSNLSHIDELAQKAQHHFSLLKSIYYTAHGKFILLFENEKSELIDAKKYDDYAKP